MSASPRLFRTGAVRFAFFVLAVAVSFSPLMTGCDSQLEEEPFSQITPNQFFSSEADFLAAAAAAYAQLRSLEGAPRLAQEHASDEIMVPTRGPDWGDGGDWRALTQHTWTPANPRFINSWNGLQTGIARTNGVLESLNHSEETLSAEARAGFQAEMRYLRALYYYSLMDLFGGVPIVVETGSELDFPQQDPAAGPPPQNTRLEVFDFILSELTGCTSGNFSVADCIANPGGAIQNLSTKGGIEYGRATKGAAYALLARLLLNAEIYTGEASTSGIAPGMAMYAGAAAAADWIIDSGQYELEDDYFANFAADNFSSQEMIFAATHAAQPNIGFSLQQQYLHYNHPIPGSAFNGFTTIAAFYEAYDTEPGPDGEIGTADDVHNDQRGKSFLVGQQYESPNAGCSGDDCFSDPTVDADGDGDALLRVRGTGTPPPLNITLEIPSIILDDNVESPGARVSKYELDPAATDANMGNDFPLFRLAEIYLIKAEAENELNGPGAASPFISAVHQRSRADGSDDGMVTAGSSSEMRRLILQERGFEMVDEAVRRQDLIRYEFAHGESPTGAPYTSANDPYAPTFTAPWLFKEQSEGFRALFPIPEGQLSVNPNLQQNPGY